MIKLLFINQVQSIFNCLIKFDKKKYNIEDFSLNSVWKKIKFK